MIPLIFHCKLLTPLLYNKYLKGEMNTEIYLENLQERDISDTLNTTGRLY
jgi:hypothetical protein